MFLTTSPLTHKACTQATVSNHSTPNITTAQSHLQPLHTQCLSPGASQVASVPGVLHPLGKTCILLFPKGFHEKERMGTRASRVLAAYNLPYTIPSTYGPVCKPECWFLPGDQNHFFLPFPKPKMCTLMVNEEMQTNRPIELMNRITLANTACQQQHTKSFTEHQHLVSYIATWCPLLISNSRLISEPDLTVNGFTGYSYISFDHHYLTYCKS